jgi:hypothetical protein
VVHVPVEEAETVTQQNMVHADATAAKLAALVDYGKGGAGAWLL